MSGRESLGAGDGERRNFHRSARAPPAACGHAGAINRRYDTAGHSLNSRLCRVPDAHAISSIIKFAASFTTRMISSRVSGSLASAV